jgi:hypothetical protein
VRSDARGDFVAELVATTTLSATVRGHESVRDLAIDSRTLPENALHVRLDRTWAAPGERVGVVVADDDGGWPVSASVSIATPAGRVEVPIGPGRAAVTSFIVPPTTQTVGTLEVVASLVSPGRVQTARASIWTGRSAETIEIATPRAWARAGDTIPLRITLGDLAGDPRPGPIAIVVRASDGNRAIGPPRSRTEASADASGVVALDLALPGGGPLAAPRSAR